MKEEWYLYFKGYLIDRQMHVQVMSNKAELCYLRLISHISEKGLKELSG